MFDLFAQLLPPASRWTDPLFRTDARGITWGSSWAALRTRMLRWGVQMLIVMLLSLIAFVILRFLSVRGGSSSYYTPLSILAEFLVFAFLGGVALNVILDFIAVSAGLGTISGDFNMRRSDLIRLTLLRPTQIVESKHTLAQVRVLRMTYRIMWLRVWVVVMSVAALLWAWFDNLSRELSGLSTTSVFNVLVVLLVGVLSVFTYIAEPYWRMKAVTSLGVLVSARTMNGVSATMNAGFTLIAFWFGQGFVIFFLLVVLQIMVAFTINEEWFFLIALFCCWAAITGAIYLFYGQISRNSLFQAAYRLATIEN